MNAQEIKKEYYKNYVSDFGLGLLGVGHSDNANGILFLAYQISKHRILGVLDGIDEEVALKAFFVTATDTPGVAYRGPHNNELEAHDNLIGRAGLSALMRTNEAKEMCEHGNKSGWSFNSLNPDKQELRTTLQGGTICFIKMCAGFIPYPIEFVWMLGGILTAGFRDYPSTININKFQCEILDYLYETKVFTKKHWTYWPYRITSLIFRIMVRNSNSYTRYMGETHPTTLADRLINQSRI